MREPFPYVRVRISIRDWQIDALALLDTGYSGDVMIPADALPHDFGDADRILRYRVADDRITTAKTFYGEVTLPGMAPMMDVAIGAMGSRFLIGQGVIEPYIVTLVRGERVVFEE